MDKLLAPEVGLIFWTVVTFLCLVWVMKKIAWGPIIEAIEEREGKMRSELEGAQTARGEAEKIRAQLEQQVAGLQTMQREMLAQATKEGEALRAKLKADAEADAQRVREKTMAELSEEKDKLTRELRKEVAGLSVMAAERLMRKTVDDGVQKSVLEGFFHDLESRKAN